MVIYGDSMRRRPLTDTKDHRGGRRITARVENGGFAAAEGLERIFLVLDQSQVKTLYLPRTMPYPWLLEPIP